MPRTAAARIARRHPARIPIDEDIELRLLTKAHANVLFALTASNRDYLRRWLPWVDGIRSPTDTMRFIDEGRDQLRRNDGFHAGIWYCRELVGVIGYHYWNWTLGKTEIGYWLAAKRQGEGIVTRSCRALVDYAFRNLGLNRIEIRTAVGNARSRAVAERLGFAQEGVLREAEYSSDGPVDQAAYGLLRKDWESRTSDGRRPASPTSPPSRSGRPS